MHYEDLIGRPFKYGARGPQEFDCWGLAKEMLSRQGVAPDKYGWSDEKSAIQHMLLDAANQSCWRECEVQKGAVMLFRVGRFVSHVGFALNGTQFIHTWERSGGVVVESLYQDWHKRLVGCYQYVEHK
jgi:cell wall-associated NlpC family hydrolase